MINLSKDEAQMLADVLSMVGGNDKTSRRRFQDTVSRKLEKLGVPANFDTGVYGTNPDRRGGIDFIK